MIKASPCFLGITRPPTWMGAPYMHVILSIMVCGIVFIMMSNLLYLGLYIPFHMIGVLFVKLDPYFYNILAVTGPTRILAKLMTGRFWKGAHAYSDAYTRWAIYNKRMKR